MKIEKIKEILMLGEDHNIEFKSQYQDIENIGPIICGYLNATGGYIVCGVEEDGKITGIDESELTINTLEKKIAQEITPTAIVFVQKQNIEGQSLLIIEVPPGQDQPYAFRNDIYIRKGEKTQKADVKIIRELIQRKKMEPERWEHRFSSADLEKDLDLNEIRSTLRDILKKGRISLSSNIDSDSFLETLSVTNYGRLTNAGDVLFGLLPATRNPQIRVRASIFSKEKTTLEYQNTKSFEGPLGVILEYSYNFILNYTPTKSRFRTGDLKREDKPLYPMDAIREGLINAFAHRDYSDFSGGITIQIYSDRLEIWNSAKFPEGRTLEQILNERRSVLQNPDIAHVLYLRGFMEKTGRGSDLIRNACLKNNLPPPKWIGNALGVTLILFAPKNTPELKVPQTQELKVPQTQELKVPQTQELKVPQTQEFKVPQTQEFKVPQTQEVEVPQTQELKVPQTQELKVPQTQEVEVPQTQEVEVPQTQELKVPQTQEVEVPQTQELSFFQEQKIIELLKVLSDGEKSRLELQNYFSLNDPESFRKRYLRRAIDKKLIEMTGLKHNPNQKYRITEFGRQLLNKYNL